VFKKNVMQVKACFCDMHIMDEDKCTHLGRSRKTNTTSPIVAHVRLLVSQLLQQFDCQVAGIIQNFEISWSDHSFFSGWGSQIEILIVASRAGKIFILNNGVSIQLVNLGKNKKEFNEEKFLGQAGTYCNCRRICI
jgi:hypothetical protein